MESDELLRDLTAKVESIRKEVAALHSLDERVLTWRPGIEKWSVLEVIEHLNRYGAYYLPEIETAIRKSRSKAVPRYKGGWLGTYFAKSMLPGPDIKKMKTFKDKDPIHAPLTKNVLEVCIQQMDALLDLLQRAHQVNLEEIRIKTSITSLIRLKLGDTFQFYIHHMVRHVSQIKSITDAYARQSSADKAAVP